MPVEDSPSQHILDGSLKCYLCEKIKSGQAVTWPQHKRILAKHPVTKTSADAEMAGSVAEAVKLPGFGLPVTHSLEGQKAFPHAISDMYTCSSLGVTLRERRMLDFMNTITDKPEWDRKVLDETIVAKWKEEAMKMPHVEDNDVYMTDMMFENSIKELREKAARFAEVGFVDILDAELTVVKSDTAVSAELANGLRTCVKILEGVPESAKDWHPRSDNQVLDLLHPSLFPVIYGRSKALPFGTVPLHGCAEYVGQGEVIPEFDAKKAADDRDIPHAWGKFQWLPSNLELTDNGAKLTSYVNNLHPQDHQELYVVLERFVECAVPLWEECLSWWNDRRRQVISSSDDDSDYVLPEGVVFPRPKRLNANGELEEYDDDDEDWKYSDEYDDFWIDNRVLTFHEVDDFKPFTERVDMSTRVNLRQQFPEGLQVIFKLANIYLTPEKPEYPGGSWHIEGALNERICATALYYYDQENITDSRLAFRQSLDTEHMLMIPAQNNHSSLECYMGVEQEGVALQELGSVLTRPGRLLTFPNALQHQVQPFTLQDSTKPGHRKILAMFLIDPNRRVLSTANVPPQRKDWWAPEVLKVPRFAKLPGEIFDQIIDAVQDFPISWSDALGIRENLMDERSWITEQVDAELQQTTFFFCEH